MRNFHATKFPPLLWGKDVGQNGEVDPPELPPGRSRVGDFNLDDCDARGRDVDEYTVGLTEMLSVLVTVVQPRISQIPFMSLFEFFLNRALILDPLLLREGPVLLSYHRRPRCKPGP